MAAVLVPLPFGRELIPASQKSACRTDPATQQLATPALRSTSAPRAAAFEQPENARIKLPRGLTSTDFEAENCAEMALKALYRVACAASACEHGDAENGVVSKSMREVVVLHTVLG